MDASVHFKRPKQRSKMVITALIDIDRAIHQQTLNKEGVRELVCMTCRCLRSGFLNFQC